jgi:general secretion pathway protein C
MMKHLPLAVFCAGLAILAVTFGSVLVQPSAQGASQTAPLIERARTPDTGVDLAASKGLFGVSEPTHVPKAASPVLPPLELTGVLVAARPAESKAMIQTGTGIEFFRLGDVVATPFALTEIGKDSVTVSDGKTDHVLKFDVTAAGTPTDLDAKQDEGPYRTAAHRAISAKLKKPETTAEYIEYWRERVRRNPGEVLNEIGLIPSDRGYSISKQQDIGVRLAGFRAGDLITQVNGVAVGNAYQDRKSIDAILAKGLAQITFERNGEVRVLTFPLR